MGLLLTYLLNSSSISTDGGGIVVIQKKSADQIIIDGDGRIQILFLGLVESFIHGACVIIPHDTSGPMRFDMSYFSIP